MTLSTKAASLQQLFIEERVGTVDAAVLATIIEFGKLPRTDVCSYLNMRESTACGALDRLMQRGLIEEAPERVFNAATKRNVKAYQPKEQPCPTHS